MDAEDARLYKRLEREMYRFRRKKPTPIPETRIIEECEPSVFDFLLEDSINDDSAIGPDAGHLKPKR